MGFGILFFGYCLFLNFAYYSYTDAIAAVICWYALTKLSTVNRGFKIAGYTAGVLCAFGVYELSVSVLDSLALIGDATLLYSVSATVRYALIAIMTVFMLTGQKDVAGEVGLSLIRERCHRLTFTTIAVYSLNILLEIGELVSIIDRTVILYVALAAIIATLLLVIFNLSQIHACYAKICMPGEDDLAPRKSKIGFVNAFRAHEQKKRQEYVDYKLGKLKSLSEKNKKGSTDANEKK